MDLDSKMQTEIEAAAFRGLVEHLQRRKDVQNIDLGERLRLQHFGLKYLSPDFLESLFRVPGYVEEAYQKHKELITDANPEVYES